MDPILAEQIVADAAQLINKTAELETQLKEAADKEVTARVEADTLKKENDGLKLADKTMRQTLKVAAESAADKLVERGLLDTSKVAQFVDLIVADPAQAFDVMEKIATQSTAQQLGGAAGEQKEAAGSDPLSAWATS